MNALTVHDRDFKVVASLLRQSASLRLEGKSIAMVLFFDEPEDMIELGERIVAAGYKLQDERDFRPGGTA